MSTGSALLRWILIAIVIVAGYAARTGSAATTVIALNPQDSHSFYLYGDATLDVGTGSVQVNSNANTAAFFQGSKVKFVAGEVNVVGDYDVSLGPPLSMDINVGRPFLSDPLANLPAPPAGPPAATKITGSGTFYPGYYPQGLALSSSSNNITLMPGVYVLDNGMDLLGGTLHGEGVMFYLRSGTIYDRGNANMFLSPPTEGPYRGISIFQAHDNATTAEINGGTSYAGFGDAAGIGTLYFPAATLKLGGTGDLDVNGIIADKIIVYGSGVKTVVPEPSIPGLLLVACAGLMRRKRHPTLIRRYRASNSSYTPYAISPIATTASSHGP